MATYFVSRHERAHFWMRSQISKGRVDYQIPDECYLTHLDVSRLDPGDTVVGTLPFGEVLALQGRGARFIALVMDLPEHKRGVELSATEMSGFGARLLEVSLAEKGAFEVRTDPSTIVVEDWSQRREVRMAFVSDQLAPLFEAAQQYRDRIDHIVFIGSNRMLRKAELLVETLNARGWPEQALRIAPLQGDGEDYQKLMQRLREIGAELRLRFPDHRIVGDITGGTKPMALALERLMSELRAQGGSTRCVYTNTDAGLFQWIAPMAEPDPITVRLDLEDLLALQGKRVIGVRSRDPDYLGRAARRRRFTLHQMSSLDPTVLGVLNAWCSVIPDVSQPGMQGVVEDCMIQLHAGMDRQAVTALLRKAGARNPEVREIPGGGRLPSRAVPVRDPEAFVQGLKEAGLASDAVFSGDGRLESLALQGVEAARYLSGGWLEEWAWWSLEELTLDQKALSVVYADADAGSNLNEIDLALEHRNRLLVVEAKTVNFGHASGASKAADALYALDSKSNALAQLFGSRLLLSRRKLSDFALLRARQLRICVLGDGVERSARYSGPFLEIEGLRAFPRFVRDWMESGRLPPSPKEGKPKSNPGMRPGERNAAARSAKAHGKVSKGAPVR